MSEATLCVQCGPGVRIDDDGTCAHCGATAIGPYADKFRDLEAEVERLKERHRQAIHEQALSWQASLTAWANRAEAAEAKLAAVNDALESSDDYENFECWHRATLGLCGNERCLACNVYLAVKAPMPADPEAT